jgi:hypothetical protein
MSSISEKPIAHFGFRIEKIEEKILAEKDSDCNGLRKSLQLEVKRLQLEVIKEEILCSSYPKKSRLMAEIASDELACLLNEVEKSKLLNKCELDKARNETETMTNQLKKLKTNFHAFKYEIQQLSDLYLRAISNYDKLFRLKTW